MRYRYVLFDLDGTVMDTGEGITKSAAYALGKFGIHETDQSRLDRFVGPPLMDSFVDLYGMSEEDGQKAIGFYRERYEKTGIFECSPYAGIPELLENLQQEGRVLAVASSKPEVYVRKILEKFQLGQYFSEVVGPTLDEKHASKPEIIGEVFKRCGISGSQKKETVMIGDRLYDIKGAASMDIDSIGVYYGFAEAGELEEAGATWIAATVEDLSEILREN